TPSTSCRRPPSTPTSSAGGASGDGGRVPGGRMNAIGYVRVSKREQAESGLGLEDQRSRIAEACAARGWNLLRIEADEGVSGGSTRGRDALARALEDLSAGRAE